MKLTFAAVVVLFLGRNQNNAVVGQTERAILERFFETTDGDKWKQSSGWPRADTTTPLCSWYGISCEGSETDNEGVIAIDLESNNLAGRLPHMVWWLPKLRTLNVQDNAVQDGGFTGFRDVGSAVAPAGLAPVEVINIKDNGLTSLEGLNTAPDSLGELHLTQNRISTFPTEILELTALRTVYLSFNEIVGTIPTRLGQLTGLTDFYCYGNLLTGTVPTEVGNLVNMKVFTLAENRLTGTLPTQVNNMVGLHTFSIHNDQENRGSLTGRLIAFDNLPNLNELYLDGNALTGPIPDNFLGADSLTTDLVIIGLSKNKLQGSLPEGLGKFASLNIDVTGNQIEGIPEEFCSRGAWQSGLVEQYGCDAILCPPRTYTADGRQVSNDLPCIPCIGGSSQLYGATVCVEPERLPEWHILGLLYTTLGGASWEENNGWAIFDRLLQDANLEDLNADSINYCDGWFGIECQGGQVWKIELDNNRLEGVVPNEVFDLPILDTLDLSRNAVTMDDKVSFEAVSRSSTLATLRMSSTNIANLNGLSTAARLKKLFMDGLKLSSGFPVEITSIPTLEVLHFAYSGLSGQLPTEIGRLTAMTELNLYANGFVGQIPSEIGLMTGLTLLELSENKFDGRFPDTLQGLQDIQRLHVHQLHGALTGPVPAFAQSPRLRELSLDSNSFTGAIPDNFLSGITDVSALLKIGLSFNSITGPIPASLDKFLNMNIQLQGNQINGLPAVLCDDDDDGQWMDGEVQQITAAGGDGCDAILCPPSTWSLYGKASILLGTDCAPCASSQFFGTTTCGDPNPNPEQRILDELFASTGGRYWTSAENWTTPGATICQREGVECTGGATATEGVQILRLNKLGLKGEVNQTIYDLPELRLLGLSENQITLKFDNLDKASNLEVLQLSDTAVTSLENLERATDTLVELHLASNHLNGTFPTQLLQLTSLNSLFLTHNQFTGTIPTEISQMVALTAIHMSDNDFTGFIPTEFGLMGGLIVLEMSENKLSGNVPDQMSSMANLHVFRAGNQGGRKKLGGPLPSFNQMPAIDTLDLRGNVLTGTVAADFLGQVPDDREVRILLADNELSGGVPGSFSRFSNLFLDLTDNKIDTLPATLCVPDNAAWMDGNLGVLGNSCDAIMCPPGKFLTDLGRQVSTDAPCLDCPSGANDAPYYGTKKCVGVTPQTERTILAQLYDSLNGTNWINQKNWKSDKSVCTWYGVTCDENGAVSELSLEENGLRATKDEVSSLFFALPFMTKLDVKGNSLPLDLSQIPVNSPLRILQLSSTGLTSIDGLQKASDLRRLHLTDNSLAGPFPTELLSLTQLRSIYISFNQFTGSLPRELRSLSNLEEFYCYGNLIEGTIPGSIFPPMTNLKEFIISDNMLTGGVPSQLENMPNLEQISLYGQSGDLMSGTIPAFLGTPKLWYFDVSDNRFSGPIPSNFLANSVWKNDADGGTTMYFLNNQLTGTIPTSLDDFVELDIDITGNLITSVPSVLCTNEQWMQGAVGKVKSCSAIACPPGTFAETGKQTDIDAPCRTCEKLTNPNIWGSRECVDFASEREILLKVFVESSGNGWTERRGWGTNDPICGWYGVTCDSGSDTDDNGVTDVVLDDNDLEGFLPSDIYLLPKLTQLSVKDNENLVVSLDDLFRATNMEILGLNAVKIPQLNGISWPPKIREIHMTAVGISGQFPEEIFELASTLEGLYIAFNGFTGTLSPRFGELTNLKDFYSYDNDFSGRLPKEIARMTSLQNLVLSENLISGPLPTEISEMPNLGLLSIYRRIKPGKRITGPIPAFDKNPLLTDLYLDHNDINDHLPDSFLAGANNIRLVRLNHNLISGFIPEGLLDKHGLFLDMVANQISAVAPAVCDKHGWMDGAIGTVGCEAFMCPPGKANPAGRANGTIDCTTCPVGAAEFYGSVTCDSKSQQTLLTKFFQSTGGTSWYRRDGWGTDSEVCGWYGVGCVGGRVTHLRLGANNLANRLDSAVFELPYLETLWVYSNPIEIDFSGIGAATRLTDLRLEFTFLDGFNQLDRATSLTRLNLEYNKHGGEFPEEILALTNLRVLEMGHNRFNGPLPPGLNALSRLNTLHLEYNEFRSTIPSFEALTSIRTVRLNRNKFTGNLPPDLFWRVQDDTAGIFLDVSDNNLEGQLPGAWKRFEYLTILSKNNRFTQLNEDLCLKTSWNLRGVFEYGCDALMCKPGYASPPFGRQFNPETSCEKCRNGGSPYYGAVTCFSSGIRFIPGVVSIVLALGTSLTLFL